jgi:hypothetical protein
MTFFAAFVASLIVSMLLGIVYVFGELEHYKRGGDVWDWTIKLAHFLKGRK